MSIASEQTFSFRAPDAGQLWRVLSRLTLWGLIVPEAMAYAGIAGLPPQAGLYTLVASLLINALLGN